MRSRKSVTKSGSMYDKCERFNILNTTQPNKRTKTYENENTYLVGNRQTKEEIISEKVLNAPKICGCCTTKQSAITPICGRDLIACTVRFEP